MVHGFEEDYYDTIVWKFNSIFCCCLALLYISNLKSKQYVYPF